MTLNVMAESTTMNQSTSITPLENATAAFLFDAYPVVRTEALVLTITSCVLSSFGSVAIIATYFAFPAKRNYIRKLLLFLTLANILHVFSILMGVFRYIGESQTKIDIGPLPAVEDTENEVCIFQSVLSTYAPLAEFLWTIVIAFYYFTQIRQAGYRDNLSTKWWGLCYQLLCWLVPAIICTIALYKDVYGETYTLYTGPWCWITSRLDRKHQIIWMTATLKGWEVLTYLILAILIVYIVYKRFLGIIYGGGRKVPSSYDSAFQEETGINARNRLRKGDRNFFNVWLIFYALRIWGTVRFFMHVMKPMTADDVSRSVAERVLMDLQAFGDTGQAFVNFICLCVLDGEIQGHYRQWCCRCRCSQPHLNDDTNDDMNDDDTNDVMTGDNEIEQSLQA